MAPKIKKALKPKEPVGAKKKQHKVETKEKEPKSDHEESRGEAQGSLSEETLQSSAARPMSIEEKVTYALRQQDAEEVALKLTRLDRSIIWSRFQTESKKNPALADEYKSSPKKLDFAVAWFIDRTKNRFKSVSSSVTSTKTIVKEEEWVSQKQAWDRWGEDLEWHIMSGRVIRRECLGTPGCYEFSDQQQFKSTKTYEKAKCLTYGQEEQLQEGDETMDDVIQSYFDSEVGPGTGLCPKHAHGIDLDSFPYILCCLVIVVLLYELTLMVGYTF